MENFAAGIKSERSEVHHLDHRLNSVPFFYKFVSRLEKNFADDALSPGMYIPIDLVKRVLAMPPHKISYSLRTRHLNNTEFAGLFREGWIGSANDDLDALRAMIKTALGEKRSVLIAIDRNVEPKVRGGGRLRELSTKGLRA